MYGYHDLELLYTHKRERRTVKSMSYAEVCLVAMVTLRQGLVTSDLDLLCLNETEARIFHFVAAQTNKQTHKLKIQSVSNLDEVIH